MKIRRAAEFEWNLNTWATLIGFGLNLVVLAGGIWYASATWSGVRRDVADLKARDNAYEEELRDLSVRSESSVARVSATAESLEGRVVKAETEIIRLSDRVSADGARAAELGAQLRDLQNAISEQGGDIKVIIAWIDEQRRKEHGLPAGTSIRGDR